jgi:hypothetical protein
MADRYAAAGSQDVTTGTPGDSSLSVAGVAATRGRLYDILFGTKGTPADNVLEWLVRFFDTSAGTSTGVTPVPLDEGSAPVAQLVAGENHTVEPTAAGTPVLDFGLNQRATFRWVVAPDGELVIPAVTTEGVFITAFSAAYTGEADATAHWFE